MPNYAEKLGRWLLENIGWVVLVLGVGSAAIMLARQNTTKALITFGATIVGAFLCFNIDKVVSLAKTVGGWILGAT